MTENMMRELKRKEQSVETALQGRIDFLTKRHAGDVSYFIAWMMVELCFSFLVPLQIAELQQKIAKLRKVIDEQEDENNRLYDELKQYRKDAGVDVASDESISEHDESVTITIDWLMNV